MPPLFLELKEDFRKERQRFPEPLTEQTISL
jgi:hypothetical protein